MSLSIVPFFKENTQLTIEMITKLMNYHRDLNKAPDEYYVDDNESSQTLKDWLATGELYHIYSNDIVVGFCYLQFYCDTVASLQDFFITEAFRHQGIGKQALHELDTFLITNGVESLLVEVIPRNEKALKLYRDCGFDHLNLIQLRKNYRQDLNKQEEIELLGFNFKKY